MAGPSEYQVALITAIGTVAMLILAIAIILFMVFYQKRMIQEQLKRQQLELDYQQRMMEAALESQENERRRLASDLHDSVGGMLSTIRVGLTTLAKQLDDQESVVQSKQMLDDTIHAIRQISLDLMPSTLVRFGLIPAVKELCDRFHTIALLPVNFNGSGEHQLGEKKELMVFRIVQELVNNAIKHSKASVINVTISGTDTLQIVVEDDGNGFDVAAQHTLAQSGKGLGLFTVQNRVRLLNGKLEFNRQGLKGSKIVMTMPL